MRFPVYSGAVALAVLFSSATASAQDSSLLTQETPELTGSAEDQEKARQLFDLINPVVTTATKDSRRVEEAPSIISVITRQEFVDWGYSSVAEAVQSLVGIYVVDDHRLPNIGVRGISAGLQGDSSIIKVLINGAPVAFRSTSGNWLGPELIPLSLLDHIEVVRGPASALYGADAFLGVINIITRDAANTWLDGRVGLNRLTTNATVGSDVDVSLATKQKDLHVTLGVRMENEDRGGLSLPDSSPAPQRPSYDPNRKTSPAAAHASRVGMARLQYDFTPAVKLTATGYISTHDFIDEYASIYQLLGGRDDQGRPSFNLTSQYQGYANLQLNAKVSETVDLTALATYFYGYNFAADRLEVGSPLYYVHRDLGFSGAEASLEARWQTLESLTLTAGVGVSYDDERTLNNIFVAKQPGVAGANAGANIDSLSSHQARVGLVNPGVYGQAVWTIDPKYLTLSGGIRYDYHNIYKSQPSWRLAAVSLPFDKFSFKALYGSAFKAPQPLLLYSVPSHSGDIVGNPGLNPQRVQTFEVQGTYRPVPFVSIASSVAYSLLIDKAEFIPAGQYSVAANVGRLDSISWESRAQLRLPQEWQAFASFELQSTQRHAEDTTLTNFSSKNVIYPPYQVRGGVIHWFKQAHLSAMVSAAWVSARRATDQNAALKGRSYDLPSYVDLSAQIATYDLHWVNDTTTQIALVGRNLLGSTAGEAGFNGVDYPHMPRTFLLNVMQGF